MCGADRERDSEKRRAVKEKKNWLNKRTLPTSHTAIDVTTDASRSPLPPFPFHPLALWFSTKAGRWVVHTQFHLPRPSALCASAILTQKYPPPSSFPYCFLSAWVKGDQQERSYARATDPVGVWQSSWQHSTAHSPIATSFAACPFLLTHTHTHVYSSSYFSSSTGSVVQWHVPNLFSVYVLGVCVYVPTTQ